ncbi:MAG TPA: hypothetical protein DEV59_02990 [Proteus sp.]|nr:hypothetical protein [Proteus sp. (in: enterobacteria)]
MKVFSCYQENINHNAAIGTDDNSSSLSNKLSKIENSGKALLLGDEKLKNKNIRIMCEELLQCTIPKEGKREYELIELNILREIVSSRISYTKYSKSVTELFNSLRKSAKRTK